MPYKLMERYPDSVHIDPHLDVFCFNFKCRPTWGPHYQNSFVNQYTTDIMKNWRNDTFVLHFTYPTPNEFKSPAALLAGRGMIAEAGQTVLEQSGMVDYFRDIVQQNRTCCS
jgi:hypothetical protein